MSILSKTRKDQKAHEHTSNPCEKRLKPMKIATTRKSQNQGQAKAKPRPEEMLEWRPPALRITPPSHAHTASPRPLARTHDTNTKRNRNRFPNWRSPSSINSFQSPIYIYIYIYTCIYIYMGSVGPVGCWWALKCLQRCFLMYYGRVH